MPEANKYKLVECPRDAMQGWKHIIPTKQKIKYINALLKVGYDTIDFGSFVSPKAIPQMADTAEVIRKLEVFGSRSRLLAIIANSRGAAEASVYDEISYLGFPFSVSPTFQLRNTNSTPEESLERVEEIQNICIKTGKKLVVYLSMGFGNPYGDEYSRDIVFQYARRMVDMDIEILSLADTVGLATAEDVYEMTSYLVQSLPSTSIGVHLHSGPDNWRIKLEAAVKAGCRRFDGALNGIGGCPMAGDDLVGNMNTLWMLEYFHELGIDMQIDKEALRYSLQIAQETFI